ncbi:hypothetical protein BJ742DRAFT_375424 [Cladochytrium replicatum]|nr:hypothetical protein BJ742DRAFT_375424 [Cladochytrium replicatum]
MGAVAAQARWERHQQQQAEGGEQSGNVKEIEFRQPTRSVSDQRFPEARSAMSRSVSEPAGDKEKRLNWEDVPLPAYGYMAEMANTQPAKPKDAPAQRPRTPDAFKKRDLVRNSLDLTQNEVVELSHGPAPAALRTAPDVASRSPKGSPGPSPLSSPRPSPRYDAEVQKVPSAVQKLSNVQISPMMSKQGADKPPSVNKGGSRLSWDSVDESNFPGLTRALDSDLSTQNSFPTTEASFQARSDPSSTATKRQRSQSGSFSRDRPGRRSSEDVTRPYQQPHASASHDRLPGADKRRVSRDSFASTHSSVQAPPAHQISAPPGGFGYREEPLPRTPSRSREHGEYGEGDRQRRSGSGRGSWESGLSSLDEFGVMRNASVSDQTTSTIQNSFQQSTPMLQNSSYQNPNPMLQSNSFQQPNPMLQSNSFQQPNSMLQNSYQKQTLPMDPLSANVSRSGDSRNAQQDQSQSRRRSTDQNSLRSLRGQQLEPQSRRRSTDQNSVRSARGQQQGRHVDDTSSQREHNHSRRPSATELYDRPREQYHSRRPSTDHQQHSRRPSTDLQRTHVDPRMQQEYRPSEEYQNARRPSGEYHRDHRGSDGRYPLQDLGARRPSTDIPRNRAKPIAGAPEIQSSYVEGGTWNSQLSREVDTWNSQMSRGIRPHQATQPGPWASNPNYTSGSQPPLNNNRQPTRQYSRNDVSSIRGTSFDALRGPNFDAPWNEETQLERTPSGRSRRGEHASGWNTNNSSTVPSLGRNFSLSRKKEPEVVPTGITAQYFRYGGGQGEEQRQTPPRKEKAGCCILL